MTRRFIFPFIFIIILMSFFYYQLLFPHSSQFSPHFSAKVLPTFSLPSLLEDKKIIQRDTIVGKPFLLNFFATWCEACVFEHEMLLKIKKETHINLIGVAYKDAPQNVKALLKKQGNPFAMIINDRQGDFAIDMGIYGTPETFVINGKGECVYRHVGIIDEKVWQDVLYPIVKKL